MRSHGLRSFLTVVLGAALATSCFDPVHSDEVDALGGEVNGVGPGPTHRPGQPCLVCHSSAGPGPEFAIAGTIYAVRDQPAPKQGVSVVLTDANGVTKTETSNSVGNFYIPIGQWSPTFPVKVELDSAELPTGVKAMVSRIGRNGGCAFCHYGADNEKTHMPPVFLKSSP